MLLMCAAMLPVITLAQEGQQDPTFKVDVRLVNVFASVVDENGQPYAALKKEDFKLFEDGVPQDIALFERESEVPLNIVLALDTSQSTRIQLALMRDAAHRFVRTVVRPVDALAVYQFATEVSVLTSFTNDLRKIERALNRASTGAATALYDALYLGSEDLIRRKNRKTIVVISDGGDTLSQVNYHEALRAAQQAEAIVYSVIVVPIEASAGRNLGGENALIQISQDTGGKHFYAASGAQLGRAFEQISEELRTQYLLGYYPKPRRAGSDFRRIEVKVTEALPAAGDGAVALGQRKRLVVRHRAGYFTSKFK